MKRAINEFGDRLVNRWSRAEPGDIIGSLVAP